MVFGTRLFSRACANANPSHPMAKAWMEAVQNLQQLLLLSVQAKDWSDKAVDFLGLI
jgi:hypothetical protein